VASPFLLGFRAQQHEVRERREGSRAPLVQSLVRERGVVLCRDLRVERVAGEIGLDQHLARPLATTRATGHLHQLREEPLGRRGSRR
jgi:hypothetical protein